MKKGKSFQFNKKARLPKERAQNILAGVDCPDLRIRMVDCPDLRILNVNDMKINVVKFG